MRRTKEHDNIYFRLFFQPPINAWTQEVCPDTIYTSSFFFFLFFIEDQTEIGGGLVGDKEVGWINETMLHVRDWHLSGASLVDE